MHGRLTNLQRLRSALLCLLLASLTALVVVAAMAVRRASDDLHAAHGDLHNALMATASTEADLVTLADQRAGEALKLVDKRSADALRRVDALEVDAHAAGPAVLSVAQAEFDRLNQTIEDELTLANSSVAENLKVANESLATPLAGAAALEKESTTTIRDLHPQLLGLVAAGKVSLGQAALTLRDIQTATPDFIEDARRIADDATREADEFTRPKHWYQQLFAPLLLAARIVALFF